MTVTLVWAMARNRVIGRDGDLPWHLPEDLRRFKALTAGHAVIMGRRTWQSIGGRPLPGRHNVVLTRDPAFRADGAVVCHDLDEALAAAGGGEVFVLGGAGVYRDALPRADRLVVTRVDADVDGDVRFPEFDEGEWRLVEAEEFPADARHRWAMRFETWVRR